MISVMVGLKVALNQSCKLFAILEKFLSCFPQLASADLIPSGEGCHEVTGCVSIIVENNTPLTPLKRGIETKIVKGRDVVENEHFSKSATLLKVYENKFSE